MKTFLTILLLILSAALLQGMPTSSRGRCLCRGARVPAVHVRNIAKLEYYRPSSSCAQEELVVVLRTGGHKRCLDMNREQARKIKESIIKGSN